MKRLILGSRAQKPNNDIIEVFAILEGKFLCTNLQIKSLKAGKMLLW